MASASTSSKPCSLAVSRALHLLGDPRFMRKVLPQAVGAGDGYLSLALRGRFRRFTDKYRVSHRLLSPCSMEVALSGRRSRIVFRYEWRDGRLHASAAYAGPGGSSARRIVEGMARLLAEKAMEAAARRSEERGPTASESLESFEGLAKGPPRLEAVLPVVEGHLHGAVSRLFDRAGCQGWSLVVGEGAMGSFRLLLAPDRSVARAVYSSGVLGEVLSGKEALSSVEGLFDVKVYCLDQEP